MTFFHEILFLLNGTTILPQKHESDTHVRQPVYPEPLGRPLLAHAIVAEVELAVGQLFHLEEFCQTVSQTAYFLLLLRPTPL